MNALKTYKILASKANTDCNIHIWRFYFKIKKKKSWLLHLFKMFLETQ